MSNDNKDNAAIDITGTLTTDFKYNTVYNIEKNKAVINEKYDPTGNGQREIQNANSFIVTQFRDNKIEDDGIGNIMGTDVSRSNTPMGAVTESANFKYNGGSSSNSGKPTYLDEGIHVQDPYMLEGFNAMELRSNDSNGVVDDKKTTFGKKDK